MKLRRGFYILLLFAGVVILSNTLNATVSSHKYSESYPAIACPGSGTGVYSWVSVATKKSLYRKVASKSTKFTRAKSSTIGIGTNPILIDGVGVTSIASQSVSGVWSGSAVCSSAQGEQWFIGGAADVSSKGYVQLVNSGLSEAIVDIAIWSEHGPQVGKVISVKANSTATVRLDALAAGQSRLVIRVVPRSGRVTAFLIDERKLGLRTLGGDIVNSVGAPTKDLVITGIPHRNDQSAASTHVLRLIAPGAAPANLRVELISTDGVFVPVGLDSMHLDQGIVKDIVLKPTIISHIISLRIHSDQPIQAGVYSVDTSSGHKDFLWSVASPQLVPMRLAVNSLNPSFYFTGDTISISLSTKLTSGKIVRTILKGREIRGWNAPKNSQTITIVDVNPGVVGSVIVRTRNGIAGFPLIPGSVLTRASVPNSDISVINR